MAPMKVYGVQYDIVWEDQPANCHKVRAIIAQECPEAGSLVVLPEMFATGFSNNTTATVATEATLDTLRSIARDYHVHVNAGIVVPGENGARATNRSVVISPDGESICEYIKQRPFTLGGEADAYEAGNELQILEWQGIKVAPFICYDLRFPELFRPAAAAGAELITVMASWPDKRVHHWVHLLQSRAIENQCYVVGVNRIGKDPNHNHTGRTIIVDYTGAIIADAESDQGTIFTDLDIEAQREYRKGLPFLADMKR
ncbi:MAG: nitrilase-related carbon-nitrogen hydrolase [Limisphaerales bacterium]